MVIVYSNSIRVLYDLTIAFSIHVNTNNNTHANNNDSNTNNTNNNHNTNSHNSHSNNNHNNDNTTYRQFLSLTTLHYIITSSGPAHAACL